MIRFELSTLPPSVNSQTKIGTVKGIGGGDMLRKIKSKDYVAWCNLADQEIMMQRGKLPDRCYYAAFYLIPAGACRGDLANYEKAITDAFVRMQRIPDDRFLVDFRMKFHDKPTVVVGFTEERESLWQFVKRLNSKTQKTGKSSR